MTENFGKITTSIEILRRIFAPQVSPVKLVCAECNSARAQDAFLKNAEELFISYFRRFCEEDFFARIKSALEGMPWDLE